MFERLRVLYREGKITEHHLDNAVAKGWISMEQKIEIVTIKE